MKIPKLFLPLLASLSILGCSSESKHLQHSLVFVHQPPIELRKLGDTLPPHLLLAGGGVYSTFSSFTSEVPEIFQPLGSYLVRLDPDGSLTPLTPTTGAAVREPEASFDGQSIVFSMKTSLLGKWQVYEVRQDGTGLRAISRDPGFNDFDPAYLPDDGIVFLSDRPHLLDPIFHSPSAQLYRMDGTGGQLVQLSVDPGGEFNPTVTSDGHLLFTEWNSHYKNFDPNDTSTKPGIFLALDRFLIWKTALDGTSNAHPFFGEHLVDDFTGGFLYARESADPKRLVAALVDSRDTYGSGCIVLIDPSHNADEQRLTFLTPNVHLKFDAAVEGRYREPYPLQNGLIAAVLGQGPMLEASPPPPPGPPGIREGLDGRPRTMEFHPNPTTPRFQLVLLDPAHPLQAPVVLHSEKDAWILSPIELAPRPRPQMAAGTADPKFAYGIVNSKDVYLRDRNTETVRNGDAQPVPRPGEIVKVQFFKGNFEPRTPEVPTSLLQVRDRFLGEAPVHPDGSFAAVVPANTPLFWRLAREDGSSIVEEPFLIQVRPGQVISCNGCHSPHDGKPARTTNEALSSPVNLTGLDLDQNHDGKIDLLEKM